MKHFKKSTGFRRNLARVATGAGAAVVGVAVLAGPIMAAAPPTASAPTAAAHEVTENGKASSFEPTIK